MRYRLSVIIIFCVVVNSMVYGQQSPGRVEIMSSTTVSDGPLTPMWLWANQWGRFDEGSEVYARVGDTLLTKKHFSLDAGIGGVYQFASQYAYLHEGFLSAKYYNVSLSAGLQAYSPWSINDNLTSGMFLGSSNARPIPRISAGLYNYVNIPFTKGWLQVKGGISQGFLNDYQRQEPGHNGDLLHEKFAYLRVGHWPIKPYAGVIHSAIFGGEGIEIDFWPTFFGQGSEKLGGGEATNVAGAHMGMYDFGFDWEMGDWKSRFYFQKPFSDGTGMYINWGMNKDFVAGALLERNHGNGIVNGLSLEWIKTSYQSGPGILDPYDPSLVDPDNPNTTGVFFFPGSMDDPGAFMAKYYPSVEANGWGQKDIINWLEQKVNHGYEFGGRDDYMNNGLYPAGWSYYGRSTGTPLYHSVEQVKAYAPDWNFSEGAHFVNNRVDGVHLGLQGRLLKVNYRLKTTFTMNYGGYGQEFAGLYSWVRNDNYFFEGGLFQGYYGLELDREITRSGVFSVFTNIGVDSGELYDSWGARFGIVARIK